MKWTEVLPGSFRDDPVVVAVTAHHDSYFRTGVSRDGERRFQLIEDNEGELRGLRVMDDVGEYLNHVMAFREAGTRPCTPEYLGPLSDLPDELLSNEDRSVIVMLHDAPHRALLNVTAFFRKRNPTWN